MYYTAFLKIWNNQNILNIKTMFYKGKSKKAIPIKTAELLRAILKTGQVLRQITGYKNNPGPLLRVVDIYPYC